MLGAVIGDIVGSIYERHNIKTTEFDFFDKQAHFTDDTVLSIAIADAILKDKPFEDSLKYWGRKYPKAGYGGNFKKWLKSNKPEPYNSWGNGSAMRVSPIGFAYNSLGEVLREAKKSAEVTHNHKEGIKGAQATAAAIFLARTGKTKNEIRQYISAVFNYDLNRTIEQIRPDYKFDVSCQGSVPEAIIAFLESSDFESAIRLAISIGGDSDTIACIAGGIAQAFYKIIPDWIISEAFNRLTEEFSEIIKAFSNKIE